MVRQIKYTDPRGFTLVEIVVVIAVISILASVAVPYAFKMINQERRTSTQEEMKSLYRSIKGDPSKGDGGYVGDMGVLPVNNDLRSLNIRRYGPVNQPNPQTDTYGVKYGWFGPYSNVGFDANSYLQDSWGVAYSFGSPGTGQIRSAGEDRIMGNADDIIYPPNPVNINGRVLVNVLVWDGSQFIQNPQMSAYPSMQLLLTLFYSNSGARASITAGSPSSPPYTFLNLHMGQHAVTGNCDLDGPGPLSTTSGVEVAFVGENNSQARLNIYLR
jgi:prepilin-type N-terminal cleavage/methylation domain-containing protein